MQIQITDFRGYKPTPGKNVRGFFDMEVTEENGMTLTIRDNTLYRMNGGNTFFRLPCKKIGKERYVNLIEVENIDQWKKFQSEVLKELNGYLIQKYGKALIQ